MALWAKSRLYASPAFPAGAGPDFVNAAAIIESPLSPDEILNQLHLIESAFDRTRENRWGARSLDLDLIAAGDTVLPDENTFQTWADLALPDQKIQTPGQLILPHPRLQDRAFVLIPLADVAPNWMHPVLGKTVNQMIDGLSATQRAEIVGI